ncbi:MAG: DUF2207 domain-containing protein [Pseudomonadota bacterium]
MKALIIKLSLSILIILGLGFSSAAFAEEAINNFVSNVYINNNGSADISETITVHAEQKKIQYGLVRWMPKFYRDQTNHLTTITYFVTNVLVNNLPTPYHIIQDEKTTGIFIGSPNHLLPPGDYTYLIQYHINNAVVLGQLSDQFYWNVTGSGTGWQIPIENVDATVHLPKGAFVQRYAGYTGKFGAQTHNYFVSSPLGSNEINFATTQPIAPGEELTIGVSWPAGFIHVVAPQQNPFLQFIYNRENAIATFFLLMLLIYCRAVWQYENHEPKKGSVVPLFHPPESMSPSALRYIQKMTFDNKALTVAIISMAVKGYLVIEEDEHNNFTLIKKPTENVNLSRAEQALASIIFEKSDALELNVKNHLRILHAQDELKKNLRDEYEKTFFVTHASFLVPAFVIGFFGIVVLAIASRDISTVFFTSVMLTLAVFYLSVQMPKATDAVRDFARRNIEADKVAMFGRMLITIFLIVVIVISIVTIEDAVTALGLVIITCILSIQVLFYHLLKAHTPEGRKLMAEVAGFKMYLANSKQDNKIKTKPPEKTVELYEKYLPYAIALDVEDRWGEQFVKVLTKTTSRQHAYRPVWLISESGWNGNLTINSLVLSLAEVWVLLYLSVVPRQMALDLDREDREP